jgi:protein-tyrosine-phosphatase
MSRFPDSLLFVCGENALRSPMAEAMVKRDYGDRVYVDSVGLRNGVLDALAVAVMEEMGIDITGHRAKRFDHMANSSFDMIVTLTPEAHGRAMAATRASACEVVYWDIVDPSMVEGNRDTRLGAYRTVRDGLRARIGELFRNGGSAA